MFKIFKINLFLIFLLVLASCKPTAKVAQIEAGIEAELSSSENFVLNYGEKVVGGSYLGKITLTNKGSFPISGLVASDLDSKEKLIYSGGTYPGIGGNCGATIKKNDECIIELEFTPDHEGFFSYNIVLDFNTGITAKQKSISVKAYAGTAAFLEFDDSSDFDFGIHEVVDQVERVFIVKNNGGLTARNIIPGALEAPFNFKGGAYPGIGGTCSNELKSKQTCLITIVMAPTIYEEVLKSLSLDYYSGDNVTNLSSSLQAMIVSIEANVLILAGGIQDFGSSTLQKAVTKKFKILNNGYLDASDLIFTGSANFISGANNCAGIIKKSTYCEFDVTYFPNTVGPVNESYSITVNTGKQIKNLSLGVKGTGVVPAILTLDILNVYDFGDKAINSSSFLDIKIKNTGNFTATSLNLSMTHPEYSIDYGATTCGAIILKNVTCTIRLKFNPISGGLKISDFVMNYNNGSIVVNSTQMISGSSSALGYLVFFDIDVSYGEYNFGLTAAGQKKTARMLIKNIGLASATKVQTTQYFFNPSLYYRGDFSLAALSRTISDYPNCSALLDGGKICQDASKLFFNTDILPVAYNSGDVYAACSPTPPVDQICELSTNSVNTNIHAYPGERESLDYPICGYTIATDEICQVVLEYAPDANLASLETIYEAITLNYISDNLIKQDSTAANIRFQGNSLGKLRFSVSGNDILDLNAGYTYPSYHNVGSRVYVGLTITNDGGFNTDLDTIDWTDLGRSHFKFYGLDASINSPGKNALMNWGDCGLGLALYQGSSCTVYIWFTPQSAGNFSDILKVRYFNGMNYVTDNITIKGDSLIMGELSHFIPTSTSLSAGYSGARLSPVAIQLPGNNVSRSFTLKNTGSANVVINSVNLCGNLDTLCGVAFLEGTLDLSIGSKCSGAVVAPGGNCTIDILYGPQSLHAPNYLTVNMDITTSGLNLNKKIFASLESAYPADLRFTDSGASQVLPYNYNNVEYQTTVGHEFTVQNTGSAIGATSVTYSLTNNNDGMFAIINAGSTCTTSLGALNTCVVKVDFTPSVIGSVTANLVVSFHNGAETKTKTIVLLGKGEPPASTHKGWSSIIASGDKVNVTNISAGSQSIKISWIDMIPKAGFTIQGYNIYRRDGNGFYGGGESNDYTTPINGGAISTAVKSYTDTTAIAGKVYYYEVRPVIDVLGNLYTSKTTENFREIRITAPIDNTVFIHRWMANSLICSMLGKSTDPSNNYRCSYGGPGSTFNYYDIGGDLLVDRYELGSDKTSRPGQLPYIDTQKNIQSACVNQPEVTIFNVSNLISTKSFKKRILSKKEFQISSMWAPNETDSNIIIKEAGVRSSSNCNSAGAVELTGANTSCKSYFGIEDAAGNELEWVSDRALNGVGLTDQVSVDYGAELRLDVTNKAIDNINFSTIIPNSPPHLNLTNVPCFNIALGLAVPRDPNSGVCTNSKDPVTLSSNYLHNNLYSVSNYGDLQGIAAGGGSYLAGTSGIYSSYWLQVSATIGGRCVIKLDYQ